MSENVYNKIRAFIPAPIAYCLLRNEPFKIYNAEIVEQNDEPGKIISADNELVIACGHGALALKTVQKAGGKAMGIKDFLRGNKFTKGDYFI